MSSAAEQASLDSFHLGMAIAAALVAGGGLIGAAGIRDPRALEAGKQSPAVVSERASRADQPREEGDALTA